MGVGSWDRLSAGLVPMFQPYCLAQAICPSDRVVYRLSRVPLKHENRVRVPAWSTLFCCTGVWGWERGVDKLEPNRRMGVCEIVRHTHCVRVAGPPASSATRRGVSLMGVL